MTLTDILLVILILAVFYAASVIQKRIRQMDEITKLAQEEQKRRDGLFGMMAPPPAKINFGTPPPQPNPKVAELETKLDRLRDKKSIGKTKRMDTEKKERELIAKIVDIFIMETDKTFVSEKTMKSHASGSTK